MKLKKNMLMLLALVMLLLVFPLQAFAADGSISEVKINFSMPPVQAADVSALTASTATRGCYIDSMRWYDMYGQLMTNKFDQNNATVEIVLVAAPGYYFSGDVVCTIDGGGAPREYSDSKLVISKSFSPVIWAPSIVKHPGDEELEEGGIASFVAYAACTDKSTWGILDPKGEYYNAELLPDKFPGIVVETSYDKLKIYPVPLEMDGYKVICKFTGPGGNVDSAYATMAVSPKLNGAQSGVEGEGEISLSEEPTVLHEHQFSADYTRDAGFHWYGCECGETLDKEEHDFVWTQMSPATLDDSGFVQGECRSCGYIINCETELSLEAQLEEERKAEQAALEAERATPEPVEVEIYGEEKPGFFAILFDLFT